MQVISVERWTFWSAVVILLAGLVVQTVAGPTYNFTTGVAYSVAPEVFAAGLIVFLVSLVLGRACDPNVRRFPGQSSD